MTEVLGEGKFLRLIRENKWEWVQRTKASGVVYIAAMTHAKKVILIEQFRPPLNAKVIELPAGLAGDGEDVESLALAAQRELLEETGYECKTLTEMGTGPSSAGLTSETVTLFVGKGAKRVSAGGGVEGEDIKVHLIYLADVRRWLAERAAQGVLIDPKVYAGLWFLSA